MLVIVCRKVVPLAGHLLRINTSKIYFAIELLILYNYEEK
jgi:hypothetical protein